MPNFEVVVIPAPAWAAGIQFLPTGSITADNVQDAIEQIAIAAGGDSRLAVSHPGASDIWGPIEHNLGKYPDVQAIDSAGSELNPGVTHHDENSVTLTFTAATSGTAIFN